MNELISVIIPVYNVSKYMERCINSIINQTYCNLEIIIIDDGSTDDSLQICRKYERKDTRIKVIHKENEGLGLTRNKGIDNTQGKYMVFVDSDDYMELDSIETLYRDILEHNADIVIANHFYKNKPEIIPIECKKYKGVQVTDIVYMHMLGCAAHKADNLCVSVCSRIYKTEIIKKNRLYFPSERKLIWEDMSFNSEYFLHCESVYIEKKPLYNYCYNEKSLTHKYDPNKLEKVMKMYGYMQNQIKKYNFSYPDVAVERLKNNFIGNIRTCLKLEVFYTNENGFLNTLSNIKKICDDVEVQKLLHSYPIDNYSLIQKIYNFVIVNRIVLGIYLFSWLQNKRSRIE